MTPRPEPSSHAAAAAVHPRLRDLGAPRPLRIAVVTEFYYPHIGGVSEHVHFFATEARRRGHHVDVITSRQRGARSDPHVIRLGHSQPVYANGSQARVTIGRGLRRAMRDTLRRGRYDVVHVHGPLTPTLPVLAVDEAECPVVGTFHAFFDRSVWYALGRRYFQRRLDLLSAAIAVSPAAARAHQRYFDADWTVIPNGVDVDLFSPDAPRPSTPIPGGDGPTVLFLGRLDPRNGLPLLIDAFRRVVGPARPARLVVVGDGPLRSYYQRMAGGDPRIIFTGSIPSAERPRFYAHADVYACPTVGGASFGITLLEAMACGTPIVCSDIDGFREWVTDGGEALIVPRCDASALGDALVRLIDDASLRHRLGTTGRRRALQFAWPEVTERILGLYSEVLGLTRASMIA